MYSRLTPRTKKITASSNCRPHDVDRRRRCVLIRRRQQDAEPRAPARPRPRTFLVDQSQRKPRPRPPRDPLRQPFRRPCASGRPVRTFLQPEVDGDGGGGQQQHLWRSRSGILPGANSTSGSAVQTCSSTSDDRRRAPTTRKRTDAARISPQTDLRLAPRGEGLPGSRTYRVAPLSGRSEQRRATEYQRPASAPVVPPDVGATLRVVSDGPGARYRIRSFRYSRLHRRTIDAMVPDELRRLPQQWAARAARVADPSSSTSP